MDKRGLNKIGRKVIWWIIKIAQIVCSNKAVDKIPISYLYILYTKYRAESVKLKTIDQLKAAEARERKQKYWNELYRRKTE